MDEGWWLRVEWKAAPAPLARRPYMALLPIRWWRGAVRPDRGLERANDEAAALFGGNEAADGGATEVAGGVINVNSAMKAGADDDGFVSERIDRLQCAGPFRDRALC
jgi:hypothetical protein